MKFHLEREYWPGGTNGTLTVDGYKICHTVENRWLRNTGNSCIPEGTYKLKKHHSIELGWHFLLTHVPIHGNVPIHFNTALMKVSPAIVPVKTLKGEGLGSHTKATFEKLNEILTEAMNSEDQLLLEIRSYPDAALNLACYELSWMD
jgi:hypothetical protein